MIAVPVPDCNRNLIATDKLPAEYVFLSKAKFGLGISTYNVTTYTYVHASQVRLPLNAIRVDGKPVLSVTEVMLLIGMRRIPHNVGPPPR